MGKRRQNGKQPPGRVRDAIVQVLAQEDGALSTSAIGNGVEELIGPTSRSSVRSYLSLNTPQLFVRESRGVYGLRRDSRRSAGYQGSIAASSRDFCSFTFESATMVNGDCFEWLAIQEDNTIHGVVTDPPYGLHEYSAEQQQKLRSGRGGVWRIPPSFDGNLRSPLPRFTTLSSAQLDELYEFFLKFARVLIPKLVPGANVLIASNPLVSYIVSTALADGGLERRGEIIRLVMTMRGGDRPKAAHETYAEVSVMPRSMWEPWLAYRKPLEGTVRENLKKWGTGGFRRPRKDRPFGDVIRSTPTHKREREIAPHPSLKPQAFLRKLVRAVLPLGQGIVLDPFAGSGSTLAAACGVEYGSIGVEKDSSYFAVAQQALPNLARLTVRNDDT